MVSNNVKSLEVNEEKSMAKQDEYENTIRDLTSRLSQAESRAEFAERAVQKLIKEVDRLEGKNFLRKQKSLSFGNSVGWSMIVIRLQPIRSNPLFQFFFPIF